MYVVCVKMVARILVIDEYKLDLSELSFKLQLTNNSLLFSGVAEEALRIVSTQSVDLVFMTMPPAKTELFQDFFSVLRQLCIAIPIVGITNKKNYIEEFVNTGFDDFINFKISKNDLLHKIETLIKLRNQFDDSLVNKMLFTEKRSQKIVSFFFDNLNFLHKSVISHTEIVQMKCWPVADDISDADLFLINLKSVKKVCDCCSALRIRHVNKYKPIVLIYDQMYKRMARTVINHHSNIGYTDILSADLNSAIIATKLNSFIKYKKMYESFLEKVKKSIYLAAIDATTGIYSRSFFEDFIRSHWSNLHDSAVLIMDIDKFKLINDQFGHIFADSMLKHIASTMKRYTRAADIIARYGGDEFIIFMEEVSKRAATEIARRIRESVANTIFKNATCTVSIGICCIKAKSDLNLQDAILIADNLMYRAKKIGGNTVIQEE